MNSLVSLRRSGPIEPNLGDLPAIVGRAGVALIAALYSLARFGFADGGRVFAAAIVFVALDFARLFWLRPLRHGDALEAAAIFLQAGVLGILFLAPAPFGVASDVPPQVLLLQTPTLILLLCFIASSATAARPALVWCAGAAVACQWIAGWRVILADPRTLTQAAIHFERYKSALALLQAVNQPEYFNFNLLKGAFTAAALITLVLGFGIYRIRRLARVTSEREGTRRALAAYFSPQIVDTILAAQGTELSPQEKQVAILDCDLVGFTSLAETLSPEQVAGTLQSYRSIVEAAVFAMDGAILFHAGDGVVAAFGLTGSGSDAAGQALTCARRIAGDWTKLSRPSPGEKALPLAIGVEFGPVQMGLVGEGRSMSLQVLGDPVDAAAALQWATREAHASILVGGKARAFMIAGKSDLVRALEPCPVADIDAWRLHAP
jgi:adenylate cyclase